MDKQDKDHSRAISSRQEAVFKPADLTLEQHADTGNWTSLSKQNAFYRKHYLDELKRDEEELTEEIIKMDSESVKDILPLLTTKYAVERNILSHERSLMADERTLLAEKRTEAATERTNMAENRSGLARLRTQLAQRNTFLAEKRSMMAQQRTFLAKARTELAFIRTGVAFIALATALIRYFGLGFWTVADISIFVLGIIMVSIGIYYYIPTMKNEGHLLKVLRRKDEELMQRQPRIMVLDDDTAVCNSLKVYLEKENWQVEAFINPYVAHKRLEATQFDVVITDYMMEGMNGIEFQRHIERLSPGTQVILMSRMEMLDEFVKNTPNDLFAVFEKPVDVKELKASIKQALEEKMII